MILSIDPGPEQSALVLYDPRVGLCEHYLCSNSDVRFMLTQYAYASGDVVVIERIASYGMKVGDEVFETVRWAGRFEEVAIRHCVRVERLKRVPIKVHLCGQARAKDANVRQALIDRFGGPACIKKGGSLYKVKGDEWAALAVAVTWSDLHATASSPAVT